MWVVKGNLYTMKKAATGSSLSAAAVESGRE